MEPKSASNDRKNRISLLLTLVLFLVGGVVFVSSSGQGRAMQELKMVNLSAEGPRPLADAVLQLESRCGCAITYEDPPYTNESEITDVTTKVRRDLEKFKPGEAPKVLIPKGGAIALTYEDSPAMRDPANTSVVVDRLVNAHMASGNPGRFRFELGDRVVHVIPTASKNEAGAIAPQSAVLDAPIELPGGESSGMQILESICASTGKATGTKVVLGTIPLNLFFQYHESEAGGGLKARDALLGLIHKAEGSNILSWQLLYDPGFKTYVLNIHAVHPLKS